MARSVVNNVNPELSGAFKRLLLPGLVFTAVSIGGGYATGRESVQYAGRFGAFGWLSIASAGVLFVALSFIVLELCRRYNIYDYKTLLKSLIGRLYWVYDILYICMGITIMGVLISAASSMADTIMGIPELATQIVVVVTVAIVLFFGQTIMEKFNTASTVVLLIVFVVFAFLVITQNSDTLIENFRQSAAPLNGNDTAWKVVGIGVLYTGLFLINYPSTIPTARFARNRRDSFWASVLLAVILTIPLLLTYFAIMSVYPDPNVLEANVPWLEMLKDYGSWVVVVFITIAVWTLVATAVGILQGGLNRINAGLDDLGKRPMSGIVSATISAVTLIFAAIISKIGIVALVDSGYMIWASALFIVFGVPLLTRGVWMVFRKEPVELDRLKNVRVEKVSEKVGDR